MFDMNKVDWFFTSPKTLPDTITHKSTLYLLRRDIDTCFGIDPNTGIQFNPIDKKTHMKIYCKAIWPGTMAILAGIDLLGKFLTGHDCSGNKCDMPVKQRFIKFSERYLEIAENEAALLYQLRNSLLHSFGLYSEVVKNNVKRCYNFKLSQGYKHFIKHIGDDFYQIDVNILRKIFCMAIEKYEKELKENSCVDFEELHQNFDKMHPKHAKPILIQ